MTHEYNAVWARILPFEQTGSSAFVDIERLISRREVYVYSLEVSPMLVRMVFISV